MSHGIQVVCNDKFCIYLGDNPSDSDVVLYRRGCEGKNSDIFIGGAQRHVGLSLARAPTFPDFNLKVNEIILYCQKVINCYTIVKIIKRSIFLWCLF